MTAVETWHKAKNDTFGAEVLRFPKVLPGHMGIVAVGLLTVIRTWCSENRTHIVPGHVVEALGRMYRLPDKTTGDLLGALTTSHFLTKEANDVYHLTDLSVIRACANDDKPAPASSSKPTGKTERQRRWREKQASTKASHEASTGDGQASTERLPETPVDGAASTPETGGVYKASPKASPVDAPPLSDSLPPARKQAQTQAQNPPPPPAGGAEPEQGGGQGSASEAKGETQPDLKASPAPAAEAAAVAEPDVAIEPVDPESQSAKVLARLKTYTRAYAEGISLATGKPSPPTMPLSDMRALGAAASCAVDSAGKLLRGEALLAWFREQARLYATVRADGAHFERGFAPVKFFEWLRAGASTTKVSSGQAPRARGQQIVPQPADPGPFVPSFAPMTLDDLRAEKARQKEAAAAKAAGRLP